jgi:hypothetical protein
MPRSRFHVAFPGDPAEDTPYSKNVLKRLAVWDAVVPEIWAFEIANSNFVSCSRRMRITEQQVREYRDLLKACPFESSHKACIKTSTWNRSPAAGTSLLMTQLICIGVAQ